MSGAAEQCAKTPNLPQQTQVAIGPLKARANRLLRIINPT